ncbi:aldehyde dehydrogenase [Nemania diffusa]|nr:aldehyde dehydrogenase [Nemania diffusa]
MSDLEVSLVLPNGKPIQLSTGLFINNEFPPAPLLRCADSLIFTLHRTEESIASVEVATETDVDRAVDAARAAFNNPAWRDLTPEDRAQLLHRAADLCEKHLDELFGLQAWDVGKPYQSSKAGEGAHLLGCLRYFAGWADKLTGKSFPVSKDKFGYSIRQPVGVCGAITPWNYPLTQSAWKLGPALATGNVIILKPSEHSPLAALYLAKLFKEAGYPPGVVQVLNGYGVETGEAIASHLGVDKIAFTGSTATGKRVLRSAAVNMKRVSIEAGGKTAFIVFDDADLEQAAKWAKEGGFGNSGQICNANSRILVQEGVQDKFIKLFSDIAQATTVGLPFDDATTQGPQASKMQYDKVLGYIESANQQGARLVTGGKPYICDAANGRGYFIEPTIYTNVTPNMTIFREEVFGPVIAVSTFKTEDEAVALANDSTYGLAAVVFSENLKKAHRINESNGTDYKLPFGGVKQSGLGRELGESALDGYTEEQIIHVNLGVQL